jgi:DNA polymerase
LKSTRICGPDGHKLAVADASQIEARIVAWLAGCEQLVEGFRRKEDIYSAFASVAYGYPCNKKEHPTERFVGKGCVLGLGFMMSALKLQVSLATGMTPVYLSLEECQRLVRVYREEMYPEIPALWKQFGAAIEAAYEGAEYVFGARGVLRTGKDCIWLPNGMALHYHKLRPATKEEEKYRGWRYWGKKDGRMQWLRLHPGVATENAVQALARICVSDAWVRHSLKYPVAMQVHDELLSVVAEDRASACLENMLAEMRVPPKWAPDLPLDAEGDIGDTYASCK